MDRDLRECVGCGDSFEPKTQNQKYCCPECRKDQVKRKNAMDREHNRILNERNRWEDFDEEKLREYGEHSNYGENTIYTELEIRGDLGYDN